MQKAALAMLPSGMVFHGRYRVVRCIKAGGMGAVYEVVDERTESHRALKVMLPSIVEDPALRARFALEAKITGSVVSDHIVRVLDAGIDEASATPFLVMDLLQGDELGGLVKQRGALPVHEVVLYLRQAALALDKTHAAGIVHRDLKPDNLFITYRDDGSTCVKILDFGIAKVVAQSTTRSTQAVGTPLYMSPEQLRGEGNVSPRADVYALGQIAYTLLVGEPYWHEELKAADSVFSLMMAIVTGLPEAPTARAQRRRSVTLPQAFDTWFAKCVAVSAADRFDRATSAISALTEALGLPNAHVASPSAVSIAHVATPNVGGERERTAAQTGSTTAAVVSDRPRRAPARSMIAAALGGAAVAAVATIVLLLRTRTDLPQAVIEPASPADSSTILGTTSPARASSMAPEAPPSSASAEAPTAPASASASTSAKTSPPRPGLAHPHHAPTRAAPTSFRGIY